MREAINTSETFKVQHSIRQSLRKGHLAETNVIALPVMQQFFTFCKACGRNVILQAFAVTRCCENAVHVQRLFPTGLQCFISDADNAVSYLHSNDMDVNTASMNVCLLKYRVFLELFAHI